MKRRGLSYLLTIMLIIVGMFPAGVASAADSVETISLDLKGRAVGSATLSLEGTTLTLQAYIRTNSTEDSTLMHAVRLSLGSTTVLNTALSGGEQKSFTRVIQNVQYETMKNYHLEVDLSTGGGGGTATQTKTYVSKNGFPSGAVAETYVNDDSRNSWYDLAWNSESAGISSQMTNKPPLAYMQEAGAIWVYDRANSMIINKEERRNFDCDFDLPADAVINAATLAITADDGYGFMLNSTVLPLPSNHNMYIASDGTPVLKGTLPDVPHGGYHFQSVNAYDIKSLLHGGNNHVSIQVYNRKGNKDCENVAGLIFRADITYTSASEGGGGSITGTSTKDGTLPKPGGGDKAPKLALRIDLLRINGQAVSGQAVKPGDKLTFQLTMKNEGNVDVRPDGVTITVPSGLSASKADCPDARLNVSGNTIYYTHPNTMIAVGNSDTVEFTLAVLPGATGSHTISASAPYLYTVYGDRVANPTPGADFTVTVGDGGSKGNAKLCITHELIRVNDVAVNSSTVVRPGDKLTFRMNMTNQGTFAVRPGTVPVNFSGGLYAQASDNTNPPWTTYTNSLLYTHDGTFISPGTTRSVEYVLRVRTDASGNQTIDSDVPSVIDESGCTVPNDTPKGGTSVVVVPATDVCGNLQITHQLIKINGYGYKAGDVIRPGDVLTFNMIMKNIGNAPVRPDTVQVNFSSGLYAQSGDNTNPPWSTYSNYLVYKHDGTLIPSGSATNVSYVLRVKADASGQQRVDSNVPTVIDANGRTIPNSSPSASTTIDIGGQAYNNCRLEVTHTLIRVNDVAVNSGTIIRPGDKLTFNMTMTNTGNVPVRPDTIPVYFSSGLYAQASDNSNPPWTTYSSYLLYTHNMGLINAGASQSVEYVLRTRNDATGTQSVWTELPTLIDVNGNVVNNGGTQKVTVTIIITPDGSAVEITTKFWLSAVNGVATGINPDGSMDRITLVPGDVLTYTLRSINTGAQSTAPGEYTVTLPSNQSFNASDNPNWSMRGDGLLVYTYNGPLLAPGAQIDSLLHLKLNTNAVKGNQTFTYTYNLTKVRMPDGSVVSNNNPATVSIPVCIGKFGDMDKTGDSGFGLVPVMLGSILLVGSGTTLLLTRRRKLRGK